MMRGILAASLLVAAAVLFVLPNLVPRYTLFGVRVAADFRESEPGRRAIRRFRIAVALGFLLSLPLTLFTHVPAGWLIAAPLILMTGCIAGWTEQYRCLRRFAVTADTQPVQVELSNRPDRLPFSVWVSILPFLLLLGTALFLRAHWNSIPERFPIHWGVNGVPNGWAERNVRGVYGVLIFGGLLNCWLVITVLATWYGVRRSHYRKAIVQIALAAEFALSIVPSVIALSPVLKISPGTMIAAVLSTAVAVVAVAIWIAKRAQAVASWSGDGTRQSDWVGGVWYFNRNDPSLAVPRRDGFGYTPNLARPVAWLLFLMPLAIVYITVRWLV